MPVNLFDPAFDEQHEHEGVTYRRARLGRQAGAERLGASLYELGPGAKGWTYHYHFGNEEMLIAIAGRPSLRTPAGWRELEPGELVAFRRGPDGAHLIANKGEEPARYLMLSEMNAPDVMVYPDSNKVGVISRPPGSPGDEDELAAWFRLDDQVDYWEGESPTEPPP
jgi:uncharacterized cupin superfamily protein